MNNSKIGNYYDHFDARLINDYIKDNNRVKIALKRIFKLFEISHPKKVLDLGCGIGWSSFEIVRNFPEIKILGLDLSTNLVKIGNGLFKHPNLVLDNKDLTDKSIIQDTGFDTIIMIDVFEHIPKNSYQVFANTLKQVLDKEFCIFFSCPTILTQDNLRENNPDCLQPVDEDIDDGVLTEFASLLDAKLSFYKEINVWSNGDYLHAIITNKALNCETLEELNSDRKFETRIQKIKRIVWSDLRMYLYKQNLTTKIQALVIWLLRLK